MTFELTLMFPDWKLSPNNFCKLHYMKQSSLKKKAKKNAYYQTISQINGKKFKPPLDVKITFFQPEKGNRDKDNMVAAFKSYQDGMCQAINVDDRHLNPTYIFSDKRLNKVTISFP